MQRFRNRQQNTSSLKGTSACHLLPVLWHVTVSYGSNTKPPTVIESPTVRPRRAFAMAEGQTKPYPFYWISVIGSVYFGWLLHQYRFLDCRYRRMSRQKLAAYLSAARKERV